MLETNCAFKKQIQALLRDLRQVNQVRRDLDLRYGALKKDLRAMKSVKAYKPVKGDEVDEMFAAYINKNKLAIPVKRIDGGKYVFGSRNIMAKIINGKLVIRVGGGYMSAEEFIEQYGKIEMLKLLKTQEREGDNPSGERKDSDVAGIGDIKDMMRK